MARKTLKYCEKLIWIIYGIEILITTSYRKAIFNRSINHVMLLHTNATNAAFMVDIVAMFRSKGWGLIDPEEAYSDSVCAEVPNVVPAGESILWSFVKQNEFLTYATRRKMPDMKNQYWMRLVYSKFRAGPLNAMLF